MSNKAIKADYQSAWSGPADYIALTGRGRVNSENLKANQGRRVEFVVRRDDFASLALVFVERLLLAEAHDAADTPAAQLDLYNSHWTREDVLKRFTQLVADADGSYFRR